MQIAVVVPVLNEAKTVKATLTKVLAEKSVDKIIVVDDGSTDNTSDILKAMSTAPGMLKNQKVKILTHEKNLGKGAAVRTALKELNDGYFIIQDGDLEYDPRQYDSLITHAKPDTAVYGSRLLTDKNEQSSSNRHAYWRTYIGNVLLTKIFNILYGQNLTDTYTGYKLLLVRVAKSLNLISNGFEIEAEITAKLAKKGIKIIEIPIKFNPRKYEEGKKIKALDALKGFWTFLKLRLTW